MNIKLLYICVLLFFIPSFAGAETMYVTDALQVAVRSGMGVENKILKYLKSDEKVEVLNTEGEYARLRLENGLEGWMLKRYLVLAIPKPIVILNLEAKIEKLKVRNISASEKIRNLKAEKKLLEKTEKMNEEQIKTLENKYEELKTSSADYLQLRDKHENLTKEMAKNKRWVADIAQENEKLRAKSSLMWFVAGTSAVLIGFIIGLLLQNLRYKRKRQINF